MPFAEADSFRAYYFPSKKSKIAFFLIFTPTFSQTMIKQFLLGLEKQKELSHWIDLAAKQYLEDSAAFVVFTCGLVRGSLANLGLNSVVTPEIIAPPGMPTSPDMQLLTFPCKNKEAVGKISHPSLVPSGHHCLKSLVIC